MIERGLAIGLLLVAACVHSPPSEREARSCRLLGAASDEASLAMAYEEAGRPIVIADGSAFACACGELPVVGGATEKPTVGGGSEKPTVGGGSEKPTVGGSSEKPTVGGSSEKPTVGGSSEKPTVGGASEKPTVGGASEKPTVGGASEKPTVGGASEKPTVGGASEKPTVGGASEATPLRCAVVPSCSGYVVSNAGSVRWYDGTAHETDNGCVPR